ncbi:hypothetical protein Tco_0577938 [Tanacetum coccineum]
MQSILSPFYLSNLIRFRELLLCREGHQADKETIEERYKVAKSEAKKAVVKAKDQAYEDLYKKLDSIEGTDDIYMISKPEIGEEGI